MPRVPGYGTKGDGYWIVGPDGSVRAFGDAQLYGSALCGRFADRRIGPHGHRSRLLAGRRERRGVRVRRRALLRRRESACR